MLILQGLRTFRVRQYVHGELLSPETAPILTLYLPGLDVSTYASHGLLTLDDAQLMVHRENTEIDGLHEEIPRRDLRRMYSQQRAD